MTAWLYHRNAEDKCMKLFQEMKQEYHRGNHLLKPDSFVYAQVINALAIAGKPFEALAFLSEMEQNWMDKKDVPAPTIFWYDMI